MKTINVRLRQDYKSKDKLNSVYCMVSIKGKKERFNTGVKAKIEDWDNINSIIIGKTKDAKDKNLIISNTVARINDIFVRYRLMRKEVTPSILRREFKNPSIYIDWFDFMNKIITLKKNNNSENTIKTLETVKNNFESYKIDRKLPSIDFPDIDDDFIIDFKKWLKSQGNNLNTINKKLRIVRLFINEAIKRKAIDPTQLSKIKTKDIQADRNFLDPDELQALMEEYLKPSKVSYEAERNTLRLFLFSCFTGLRISDIQNIKMENIVKNTLIFIPVKTSNTTNKTLRIPLSKPAQVLIKDVSKLRLYGIIFQTEAVQTLNKRIKTIMAAVGINRKMSFHCGRHTFATVFLRNGGKLHILQKLLGHHNIKETMKYVHIVPDDTQEQMQLFNQFI